MRGDLVERPKSCVAFHVSCQVKTRRSSSSGLLHRVIGDISWRACHIPATSHLPHWHVLITGNVRKHPAVSEITLHVKFYCRSSLHKTSFCHFNPSSNTSSNIAEISEDVAHYLSLQSLFKCRNGRPCYLSWPMKVDFQTAQGPEKNQGQGPRVVQPSDPFHPVPTQSERRTSINRIWASAVLYCTQTAWDPV